MLKEQQIQMASRIKARREALHYTQEQLAERIHLSLSSYTKIENAFQNPALDTLIKISEQLKLSLDYLVFGDESKRKAEDTNIEMLTAIFEYSDKEKLLHASEVLKKLAKIKND